MAQVKWNSPGYGPLKKVLREAPETITVRFVRERDEWPDRKPLGDYLAGLLADEYTRMYTAPEWDQMLGGPEVECLLTFHGGQEGRLLLWRTVGCIRNAKGKWWFIDLFDYFHRLHPKGTRSLARRIAK